MNTNLLNEIESRNNYLEKEAEKLKGERAIYSRRASEIQFILVGMQGEMEANKRVIQTLKTQK